MYNRFKTIGILIASYRCCLIKKIHAVNMPRPHFQMLENLSGQQRLNNMRCQQRSTEALHIKCEVSLFFPIATAWASKSMWAYCVGRNRQPLAPNFREGRRISVTLFLIGGISSSNANALGSILRSSFEPCACAKVDRRRQVAELPTSGSQSSA